MRTAFAYPFVAGVLCIGLAFVAKVVVLGLVGVVLLQASKTMYNHPDLVQRFIPQRS